MRQRQTPSRIRTDGRFNRHMRRYQARREQRQLVSLLTGLLVSNFACLALVAHWVQP